MDRLFSIMDWDKQRALFDLYHEYFFLIEFVDGDKLRERLIFLDIGGAAYQCFPCD